MQLSNLVETFCVEHVCEIAGEMKQATARTRRRQELEAMAEFWCECDVVFLIDM